MSKRTGILVALVLGGGILMQIPYWGGHEDHHAGNGHEHASMADIPVAENGAATEATGAVAPRTVALEVAGMT